MTLHVCMPMCVHTQYAYARIPMGASMWGAGDNVGCHSSGTIYSVCEDRVSH